MNSYRANQKISETDICKADMGQFLLLEAGKELKTNNWNLTFNSLKEQCSGYGISAETEEDMHESGLLDTEGRYTKLALLVSDQCPYTYQVNVFQGRDTRICRKKKEFKGSLIRQAEDVYEFISFYNQVKAEFSGLFRHDTWDYPEEALKEAVFYSIACRSYDLPASNIIHLFQNRIVFVSVGNPFTKDSESCNPDLVSLFIRLKLVEKQDTGMERLNKLYENDALKPKLETSDHACRLTLYNVNEIQSSGKAL